MYTGICCQHCLDRATAAPAPKSSDMRWPGREHVCYSWVDKVSVASCDTEATAKFPVPSLPSSRPGPKKQAMRPFLPVGVDPTVSRTLSNFAVSRGLPSPLVVEVASDSRTRPGRLGPFICYLV